MTLELQKNLEAALDAFRSNLGALLNAASSDEQKNALLDEYDSLRDSYFELLRAALQQNASGYDRAARAASAAALNLATGARKMAEVAAVIDDAATTVSLVGRLLITFRM